MPCYSVPNKEDKIIFLRGNREQGQNNKIWACGAAVAQGTHNPLVVGSNPTGPTIY